MRKTIASLDLSFHVLINVPMASREQAVALPSKEHGQRLWSVQELVSSLRLAWTKAYTMKKEYF